MQAKLATNFMTAQQSDRCTSRQQSTQGTTYPFLVLLICQQTVVTCLFGLPYLKIEVRGQFTGQCFFVDKLKVEERTLENTFEDKTWRKST